MLNPEWVKMNQSSYMVLIITNILIYFNYYTKTRLINALYNYFNIFQLLNQDELRHDLQLSKICLSMKIPLKRCVNAMSGNKVDVKCIFSSQKYIYLISCKFGLKIFLCKFGTKKTNINTPIYHSNETFNALNVYARDQTKYSKLKTK